MKLSTTMKEKSNDWKVSKFKCLSNIDCSFVSVFDVGFRRRIKWRRSPTWRPDHPNSQESPIITSTLTLWFWLLTNGNRLSVEHQRRWRLPSAGHAAFSLFSPFLEKEIKTFAVFWNRSEGRISVQNAVKLPWNDEDYYYYLVFSHQTLVPIVINRKVFDHIQLGVHNPADTVSAPDSIALFCHVFLDLFFNIFWSTCSRDFGVWVGALPPKLIKLDSHLSWFRAHPQVLSLHLIVSHGL